MIHQSKESAAYRHMLHVLKDRVEQHAKRLTEHTTEPRYQDQHLVDSLMKHCVEVVEDDYSPSFVMIDGDDAERFAIEDTFPGLPIRLCQFHFMQACISRIRSVFGRSKPGIRKTISVIRSLRRLQRCPIESEWLPSYQVVMSAAASTTTTCHSATSQRLGNSP